METLELVVRPRQERGRHVGGLRRRGLVPAVVYGHRQPAVSVTAEAHTLERVWHRAGRTHLVDLEIDSPEGRWRRQVLIRELQRDPRTGQLLHADFFVVNLREKLTADIPVVTVGEAPAVQQRLGQLVQPLTTVRVECLPSDLPSQVTADVSRLTQVDEALTVGDLELPAGVAVVHPDASEVVVKVAPARVREGAAEAAAGGAVTPGDASAGGATAATPGAS